MILIPPIMKWADKIGAIDLPDARKVHLHAIPRVGGVAMVIGALLSIIFWVDFNAQAVSLLVGFSILLFFGIWDDRKDLDYRIKFVGQILAVIVVVVFGDVVVRALPFFDEALPDYLALPFTVFALVGITNAINLSDGLDGLAGGTTLLSLSIIALLAYQADGIFVVLIAIAVAGSVFGFLRHNTYPARLFMGDTGSQFLGFSAGALAIILTQNVNTAISPVLPLIILGLPILDTFSVMVTRVYEGRSPFSPDQNHIHHKLLALGFDHYEAVLIIYIVQSLLITAAYLLKYESDLLLLLSYFSFSFTVLLAFHLAKKGEWKFHNKKIKEESKLRHVIKSLYDSGWLATGPTIFLKILVPTILLSAVIFSPTVSDEMGLVSLLLMALLLISFVIYKGRLNIIEKGVSYIVCVLAIYHMQSRSGLLLEYNELLNYLFVLMALAFALKVRFSKDRSFETTPLDFLVVMLVIIVPNMPGMGPEDSHIGEMALKLVVMFYASETLLNIMSGKRSLIRLGIMSTLAIAIVRGI